jgi:hypothetical protein
MKLTLAFIPAVIAVLCALFNLVRRKWLANLISLAIQFVAMFLVLLNVWVLTVAIIKLIVGLVSLGIIAYSLSSLDMLQVTLSITPFREGELFRAFTGFSVILFILIFQPQAQTTLFPRSPQALLFCALSIMGLSLLQLGLKAEPFYILIGLLGFLAGFELLYASLEYSALLEGLFTVIKLGLALAAPYIFSAEKGTL